MITTEKAKALSEQMRLLRAKVEGQQKTIDALRENQNKPVFIGVDKAKTRDTSKEFSHDV